MKKQLRITIGKKSYEVIVEDLTPSSASRASSGPPAAPAAAAAVGPAARSPRPALPVQAGAVTSPMAGVVKSILVGQGDDVQKGQPLVILEAMKMENQITAPLDGTVKSVDVGAGDQVQEGHVLLVLE